MTHLELRPARTVLLRYEFVNRQPSATGVWTALCPTAPGQSVTRSEVALSGASGRLDSRTLEGNELLHVELATGGAWTSWAPSASSSGSATSRGWSWPSPRWRSSWLRWRGPRGSRTVIVLVLVAALAVAAGTAGGVALLRRRS